MNIQMMLFDPGEPTPESTIEIFVGVAAHSNDAKAKRQAAQLAFLTRLMRCNSPACVDDVVIDPDSPFDDGGCWLGAAIRELSVNGIIEQAGCERSRRASRRGGLRRLWALADRDKAQAWIDRLKGTMAGGKRNDSAAATVESN